MSTSVSVGLAFSTWSPPYRPYTSLFNRTRSVVALRVQTFGSSGRVVTRETRLDWCHGAIRHAG